MTTALDESLKRTIPAKQTGDKVFTCLHCYAPGGGLTTGPTGPSGPARALAGRKEKSMSDPRLHGQPCQRLCIDDLCRGCRENTLCGGSYCFVCNLPTYGDSSICDDCAADHEDYDPEAQP